MYEKKYEPLASSTTFIIRCITSFCLGLLIIVIGLAIGMLGYRYFDPNIPWIDAFNYAALVLSDQGPAIHLTTPAGKIFVDLYALFSGLAFVSIVSIVFAPVIHRFFHSYHQPSISHNTKHNKT